MVTNLPDHSRTTGQVSILTQEIGILRDSLKPGRQDQIAARLMLLVKSGKQWPPGIDEDKIDTVYRVALERVPYVGVKLAIDRVLTGEEDEDSLYVPLPAKLAAMARRAAGSIMEDLERKKLTLESIRLGRPEPSAEDRSGMVARVRKLREDFMQAHRASNAGSVNGLGPSVMDDERAAYWQGIASLPDRSDITEEQRAFQRRVRSAVESAPPAPAGDDPSW